MSVDNVDTLGIRNEEWWFNDGNIVLQVRICGNSLFKLYLGQLARASSFFRGLEHLPRPEVGTQPAEGTVARPLALLKVAGDVFADLLHVLYLRWGEPMTLDQPRLAAVMRAAHHYQFESICKIAESQLQGKMDAVPEMQLAHATGSPEWASAAFRRLVLAFDDAPDLHILDPTVQIKVWKARQRVTIWRMRVLEQNTGRLCPSEPDGQRHTYIICGGHLRHLLLFVPMTSRGHFVSRFHALDVPSWDPEPGVVYDRSGWTGRCCTCEDGELHALAVATGPSAEEDAEVDLVWNE
ncbi:hypothetical protein EXIGLDRAFT_836456 [Exidia glandulosa HHB12029]|uniref:BTB domain-containing protein n=1 Tax=Exidia glandulosa HHB12029 TaxID=1314781 RepID=A0A165HTX0_EXIGL|nr:hypothetical protein EXIGLDRAFT_836456 [Exidia glandulosa HHB12029]